MMIHFLGHEGCHLLSENEVDYNFLLVWLTTYNGDVYLYTIPSCIEKKIKKEREREKDKERENHCMLRVIVSSMCESKLPVRLTLQI